MHWSSVLIVALAVVNGAFAQDDDPAQDDKAKKHHKHKKPPGGGPPSGGGGGSGGIFTGNTCGCLVKAPEDTNCKPVYDSKLNDSLCPKYGAKIHVREYDGYHNCAYGTTGLKVLPEWFNLCQAHGDAGAVCCDAGTSDSGCQITTTKPNNPKPCS
ncbi:hypothetical protein AC578_978 [Pseudocercospora eumusae]|uniref:Hydrophobin n=1 Tax=Pseudocercospora eumusae TaxID=321146 RepID=A0A139HEG6_9PEZI|nr:hypothetical protein AC578_978 [Pseudocercospora eumusae]